MNRKLCRLGRVSLLILFLVVVPGQVLQGTVIDVSIDTLALTGTGAALAFDLVDGDGANNTVTVSNFASDGVLGGDSSLGGVTGSLPGVVVLDDLLLLNSLEQAITLANSVSFTLTLTENNAGGVPDTFSFYLLDGLGGLPLYPTSSPFGDGALFSMEFDSPGLVITDLYNPQPGNPSALVTLTGDVILRMPEPSTWILFPIALLGSVAVKRRLFR